METQEILIRILELLEQQNCIVSQLVCNSEEKEEGLLFQYDVFKINDEITKLLSNAKSTNITWDASK